MEEALERAYISLWFLVRSRFSQCYHKPRDSLARFAPQCAFSERDEFEASAFCNSTQIVFAVAEAVRGRLLPALALLALEREEKISAWRERALGLRKCRCKI